jgi:hypothetical protein
MPDNWAYVIAAYGLAVAVFGGYWLRLGRREREATALAAGRRDRAARAARPGPPTARPDPAPTGPASRASRP